MSRGFPSMTALLGLLAVAGYQNRDKIAEFLNGMGQGGGRGGAPGGSGVPNMPGGLNLPGGLGGLLAGLGGGAAAGGAGGFLGVGLKELVESFQQNGRGDIAQSWVDSGPNKEIAPPDLERAIGPDVLATLEQRTGLSREELLDRLSRDLPQAVDRYTPDGRLPV